MYAKSQDELYNTAFYTEQDIVILNDSFDVIAAFHSIDSFCMELPKINRLHTVKTKENFMGQGKRDEYFELK